MCCLFGIIDTKNVLSAKQMSRVVNVLARACEVRGDDATGIAYNSGGKLCTYKRPLPARKMKFKIPKDVRIVMGHTRMTTQGSELMNYNNHPFYGKTLNSEFALAHNGVLYNDKILRRTKNLPKTKIETDSYIAVQLIEERLSLDADSLKYMAEALEGSFTITVLDKKDKLYFVKGDNPMAICHAADSGVYIYASTPEILKQAMVKMRFGSRCLESVQLFSGDIMEIDAEGNIKKSNFDDRKLHPFRLPYYSGFDVEVEDDYLSLLKAVGERYGYPGDFIDELLNDGFTTDDIEEMIYCQ